MTTLDQLLARETYCAKVARLLLSKRGEWFDYWQVAQVGGQCAWRTRISDIRKAPWFLDVENRQTRVTRPDGSSFVVSQYRIAPAAESSAA